MSAGLGKSAPLPDRASGPARPGPREEARILNVITRLESGGAPKAVLDIIGRLSREGCTIDLATGLAPDPGLDLAGAARAMGVKVHLVPELVRDMSPVRDLVALFKLIKIIRRGKYRLIHCHTSKAGFLGRLAGRISGASAIIYSPHGTIFEGYFSGPKTWFFILLERFAARLTTRIVTLTAAEIDQFLARGIGKREQYEYSYNGIDIDLILKSSAGSEGKRKELGLGAEDFLVACAGRLVPVKGQRFLIEAAAELASQAPGLKEVFMGAGPSRGEYEALCRKLGLEERTLFLGHRDDAAAIVAACDLYVQPSLNEGLGLAIIEAMALGKAVVATKVGGIPEVVDDGVSGLLVPPGEAAPLARAISELRGQPQRRFAMGEAGRKKAREVFSLDAAVARTRGLYEKLLSS